MMQISSPETTVMAACSAYNCSNRIGEVVEGFTFHRFPLSKPDLLLKWLTAMRKDKWVPTKNDVLCSFHFAEDQFVQNNGYSFLVPNAVPSKFEVLAPPKTLFPAEWPARLLTIRDIESDNRKGYVVEARIPLANKEEFEEWLKAHEQLSQASYVLLRKYPTASKNLSYKAEYVCIHGPAPDQNLKSEKTCPARLLVRIRADPKFRFRKPSGEGQTVIGYPCNVVLYHLHNHRIGSNTIETTPVSSEDISTVVKQKFNEMFKGGYTLESALETHKKDLFEEYTDEYEEVLNDAYVCPTLEWLAKFHENFLEEFDWDDSKIANILNDEIDDINASKGSATMITMDDDIIVVLTTPLMQRAHSMKSSGEVVFVDNSGYLDRCKCYVYVIMSYSCTEGLPLGLIITTSDSEEILTTGFKLLAELLPEKAFGSFGRQGPEVFLTANNDALQNSLKAVYPDTAVLLCAYNMSQELWRWLWNPENGIEEEHRCTLFSLAYKIMQTKSVEEFTESSNAVDTDETVQKYENFKAYFEEIKNVSDRWAVCFKNEILDKMEISGIEMASHILKDKVFLTKAYNILQLLKYYTDTMETYYRQKTIQCINNSLDTFILSSFQPEMRETSDLEVKDTPSGHYEVKNVKSGKSYYVDMNIRVCSCSLGLKGARCKHVYAVCVAKKNEFSTSVPNDDIIKKELFWIATGTVKSGSFDAQMDVDEESESEAAVATPAPPKTFEDGERTEKEESKKILERVVKNIMQKYDTNPAEFHKAIVTAAVNYQNLNNEKDVILALKNFGKHNLFK